MQRTFAFFVLAALTAFGATASADELILKHDRFRNNLQAWSIPSYWSGKLELADDGEGKVLKLVGTSGKRGAFGRATAGFRQRELFAGTRVLITVTAKGGAIFWPDCWSIIPASSVRNTGRAERSSSQAISKPSISK